VRRIGGCLLAVAFVTCLVQSPQVAVIALALALLGALLADRAVLRVVLRLGIILAVALAAALTGAVVAWSAGPTRGLIIGGALLLRLLVLVIVTGTLARAINADTIIGVTRRFGMERFGLVLGLSLNVLPRLATAAHEAWLAMQVRIRGSGSRSAAAVWWQLLIALPRLAEVVLAHTARLAEEAAAAAALRGHAGVFTGGGTVAVPAPIVVVTGPTGSGKTTTVESVVAELTAAGRQVAGFVQPGVWQEQDKVGFLVKDVATGEQTQLAQRVSHDSGEHGTGFHFTEDGLALARQALGRARSGAVLVIDELGPMELRGHGHMRAVHKAMSINGLAGVVVVVRRHLVPALLAALDAENAAIVDVLADAEVAPRAVLEALGLSNWPDRHSTEPGGN
jgi:nucleoside-triphosphatase THEP1